MDDIWDYIVSELQNRSAAERVINRIIDAVDPLKNFAEMGTPLSSIADIGTDYRFLVSGNYMGPVKDYAQIYMQALAE